MTLSALFTPKAAISIKSGEQLKIDTVLLVLLDNNPSSPHSSLSSQLQISQTF
jgi:hypothetical protein